MNNIDTYIKMLALFALVLLPGCLREDIETPEPGGKVSVDLYTNVLTQSYPATRADETKINAPMVLVYTGEDGDALFSEAVQAVAVTAATSKVELTESDSKSLFVVISYSASAYLEGTTPRQFTEAGLAAALAGSKLSDLEQKLRTLQLLSPQETRPLQADTDLIPMSGLSDVVNNIKQGVEITNGNDKMTLTRVMAKASVSVASGVGFTIKGVGAVNMALEGALYRYGSPSYDSYLTTNYLTSGNGETIAVPAVGTTTADIPLYLYETAAARRPGIIVKGEVGGKTYYYKFGFWFGGAFQPVERNRNYVFNITSPITGYETIAEAISAPPTIEGFDIKVTDDTGYDIISNGQYYLAVSNSHVEIYGETSYMEDVFTVTTNAHAGMGLTTRTISTKKDSDIMVWTGHTTINLAASATSPPGVTHVTVEMGSSAPYGEVTLKLGDLTHTVTFERNNPIDYTGRLELPHDDYVSCEIIDRGTGDWLALSTDGENTITDGVTLLNSGKLYITADPHIVPPSQPNIARHGGEFYVSRAEDGASVGRTKVIVSQSPALRTVPEVPDNAYRFIGAFWKADQTGERLIRIPYSNSLGTTWTATVVQGADWIKLDTQLPADPNVWNNGTGKFADMNTSDHLYQVSGDATSVSGTVSDKQEEMFFRIGLKSKYSPVPAAPARYGKIEITYDNSPTVHPIYVRQGEDADYLMRPQDPAGPGSHPSWALFEKRPLAAKYSPYNLTAKEYIDGTSGITDGLTNDQHIQISDDRSNAAFTEFPSQAGAYFQWANVTNPRKAYHPIIPDGSSVISGWNTVNPNYSFWENIGPTHDACPPGYRRPHDGAIDGYVSSPQIIDSEQRQSLWYNPQLSQSNNTDNCLWGYYADGFFDRGIISSTICNDPEPYSMVYIGEHRVAYAGRLFFNPNNNASLFFPAQGRRENTEGYLFYTGFDTYYWTATTEAFANSWSLMTFPYGPNWASQYSVTNNWAHPIRCVVDE